MKLLILLTVALIGALLLHRKLRAGMLTALPVGVLAVATMAAAGLHLWRPEALSLTPAEQPAGVRLGRALAADFPAGGTVLVVRMPPSMMGLGQSGILQELQESARGAGFRYVGLEDQPELSNAWQEVFVTSRPGAALFEDYLAVYTGLTAVVSLVGLPDCLPSELADPLPPFYVLGSYRDMTNDAWLASGYIKQVVTMGSPPPPEP
jgi:hypothetical protein